MMATTLPLRPGQALGVRWRDAQGLVLEDIQRLRLDPTRNGGRDALCHVTYVDAGGVSVYIARGFPLGGDLEAFVPAGIMWQAYFEPGLLVNPSYVRQRHYTQVFPRQFL